MVSDAQGPISNQKKLKCIFAFPDAQFSLKENRFIVTEGVNNTILICIVLKAGHLEKAVLLTLENGGCIKS